jgi:hypothetical protein
MTRVLIALILLCPAFTSGKDRQRQFVYHGKADSVVLAIYSDDNKELALEGHAKPPELLKRVLLSPNDINELNKLLLSKASFQSTRALLSHNDIRISYYDGNVIAWMISISSITRNITIEDLRCVVAAVLEKETTPSTDDGWCAYEAAISKKLEKFIQLLMLQHEIDLRFTEFD